MGQVRSDVHSLNQRQPPAGNRGPLDAVAGARGPVIGDGAPRTVPVVSVLPVQHGSTASTVKPGAVTAASVTSWTEPLAVEMHGDVTGPDSVTLPS